MKAYPEYKSSGIDWLGEIPSHWNRVKTQYVFSLASGETINGEDFAKNGKYPVFGGNGIRGYHDKYNLEGEHLIIGRVGALCGNIHITPTKSWVSEHALIASPLINFNIHWLAFLLDIMNLGQYSMASAQPVIAAGNVGKLYIPIPPLEEQEKIAAYLDNVTGKVDALIAEKQKQVEDLRAYRTSLITETVTRGLNPKCDFVALQNEWLPKIPCGWYLKKFKYAAIVKANLVHPEEYLQYPQVSPDCIEKNTGRLLGYKTVEEAGIISDNHLFFKGQLVYSKIRPNLNKVIIAPFDGLCSADMYPIETPNSTSFFKYLMLSTFFVNQVSRVIQERVKMPKINQEELGEILVVVPPIAEQQAIAEFLDKKTEKIDALIEELTKQLDDLAEYKKAVISEAVTGKVDVRDWTPKS